MLKVPIYCTTDTTELIDSVFIVSVKPTWYFATEIVETVRWINGCFCPDWLAFYECHCFCSWLEMATYKSLHISFNELIRIWQLLLFLLLESHHLLTTVYSDCQNVGLYLFEIYFLFPEISLNYYINYNYYAIYNYNF